jgi:hypothetical protein
VPSKLMGARRFPNLAKDEKHILLAGQRSQRCAFGERVELFGSYFETRDKFVAVANLVQDGIRLRRARASIDSENVFSLMRILTHIAALNKTKDDVRYIDAYSSHKRHGRTLYCTSACYS